MISPTCQPEMDEKISLPDHTGGEPHFDHHRDPCLLRYHGCRTAFPDQLEKTVECLAHNRRTAAKVMIEFVSGAGMPCIPCNELVTADRAGPQFLFKSCRHCANSNTPLPEPCERMQISGRHDAARTLRHLPTHILCQFDRPISLRYCHFDRFPRQASRKTRRGSPHKSLYLLHFPRHTANWHVRCP